MNIDNKYAEYVSYFEQTLRGSLNGLDKNAPSVIKEAMKYAVSDGGREFVLFYVMPQAKCSV